MHFLGDLQRDQGLFEGLDRTGAIALDDERERGALAFGDLVHEVLERGARDAGRLLSGAAASLALLGDLADHAVVFGGEEHVPRHRDGREALHLHRERRGRLGDAVAVGVVHRTDAAVGPAGDDRVADPQRALLDQDARDRAAALVEVRLDRDALRVALLGRFQFKGGVGGQEHRFEQFRDADARLGGHVDEHGLPAVLLGDQAVLGQLLADLARVGVRQVGLVDRDHDGAPAALAWFRASTVCGMTPSSAATTSTTMSVTFAPRARMAVNASWPGVSMKVIARSSSSCSTCTW